MLVFGTIAVAGFVGLLVSLIFAQGADIDADVGHDLDFDHDVDYEMGAAAPSLFSFKMFCLLAIGFGSGGFYGEFKGLHTEWSVLTAIGGALLVALAGYALMAFFYRSQVSSTIGDEQIINSIGTVTLGIEENGVGEVSLSIMGKSVTYMARSKSGESIRKGSQVKVVALSGGYAAVEEV